MNFPTSLDNFTNPVAGDPRNNPSHATQHQEANDAIEALEAKVGINSSAVTTSLDYKATHLRTDLDSHTANTSNPHSVTKTQVGLGSVDNYSLIDILKAAYPVGSIYVNAGVSTNPATLLGFGTWVAFAAGQVMVGLDGTQTEFDTLVETGGAKTVTLAESEIPSHKHWISGAAWDDGNFSGHGGNTQEWGLYADNGTYSADDPDHSYGRYSKVAGGGGAHNNLQPYIVVYMWKRTV